MKLNNKGFAISTIMYMILVLAIILISLSLALLSSRRLVLDTIKSEALSRVYGYMDNSGANQPDLMDTLTPVKYENNKWVIADPTKEWYDYDKQEWANAVILSDSGKTKKIGEELNIPSSSEGIATSDVLAMFVWIPRYSYTIKEKYGVGGTDANNPGAIDIKFVGTDVKDDGSASYIDEASNWYTHPAFTFDSDELSGIWVGKFEPSHVETLGKVGNDLNCANETCEISDGIRVLPNVISLRYQNVSNFFYVSRSMSRSGNSFGLDSSKTDTHMMKKIEWGSVAYLSQSKYGKYVKDNEEVYINNCSKYITGIAGDSASAGSSDICTNTYETTAGVKASTTGNVYGIYDMNGGAWEYVMGYLTIASETWGATSSNNDAGFESEPDPKYYDKYTDTSSNDESYKGHALSETHGWYGDYAYFVSVTDPWFTQGGYHTGTTNAGMFDSFINDGKGKTGGSFRLVFVPVS